jgi:Glycosyltransferase 61
MPAKNNLLRFDTYRQKNWIKSLLRPSWTRLRRLPRQTRLFGARIASRLLPFVSIEQARLYPPRKFCETTVEWVASAGKQFGATIVPIEPTCTVSNPLPKTVHQSIRRQFVMDEAYPYPETFVASIPKGRATERGFVITPDGQFLKDVSTYFHDPTLQIDRALAADWKLEPLVDVDGTVAVLATEGATLYYHWLFQLLPRYELIKRAGFDPSAIDYFFVNSQKSRFQRETLARLGIEPSKIISGDQVPHLRARQLIVPSVPLGGGCFRPWMIEFLRSSYLPEDAPSNFVPGTKYYISRAGAGYRRVLNEEQVLRMLQARGFQVLEMEKLSVPEQAAVMASCEVLVAPHGGGMSNIIFCSPGAKVVEIYSPELVATYFWKLSNRLGIDYYYLLGKGNPATLDSDYPQSWDAREDIEVDLELLERTLDLAKVA